MRNIFKITAIVLTLAMLFSLTACGTTKKEEKATEAAENKATADTKTADEALQGIYDLFIKDETYLASKSYYTESGATFEEKLDNGIVITVSGSENMDGTFTFPAKDGYLICESKADDFVSASFFNSLIGSIAKYYDIDEGLFRGYISGLQSNNIKDSKTFSYDLKEDGTGTMKVCYSEKPEMKELDEMYITAADLENYTEDMTAFTLLCGKIAVNGTIDREANKISFAIGEYGDKNTDLTYKSIIEIVKYFKPSAYEDFTANYTELKEVSTEKYEVYSDSSKYLAEHDIELLQGYNFMFVTVS